MKKSIFTLLLLIMLSACAGNSGPVKVASLQKNDKNLSCNQVMLEINEAEYYRKEARASKSPGLAVVVAPISYVADYMDADKAEVAADDRIGYLNRIYEIHKCDSQPVQQVAARTPQPVPAQMVPQPMMVSQPMIQYVPVMQAPNQTGSTGAYPEEEADDEESVVSQVSYELVPIPQAQTPQYQQIAYVMPQQMAANTVGQQYLNYNY